MMDRFLQQFHCLWRIPIYICIPTKTQVYKTLVISAMTFSQSDVAQSDYIGIPQRYTNEAYVQSRKQMQRENEYEDGGRRLANNQQDDNSAPMALGEVCIILMESVQYVELQGMNFQNALFNDIMRAFNFMNFELELLECENGREPFTIKCRLAMKSLLQMKAGRPSPHGDEYQVKD